MSFFSPCAVANALEAMNETKAERPSTTSKFELSNHQIKKKTTMKTNVIVVAPKGKELKALKLRWTGTSNSTAFAIQRLIPGLNKAGTLYERSDHRNPNLHVLNLKNFNTMNKSSNAWRLGTFVLVVRGAQEELRKVRNIYGDKEEWNARPLQAIYKPWGLPANLPFDDEGVPLKIAYPRWDMDVVECHGRAFEAGEPFLVLTSPMEDSDVMLSVIDFEGYRGESKKLNLYYCPEEVPWGIIVNHEWWNKQVNLFNQETRRWASRNLIRRVTHPSVQSPLSSSITKTTRPAKATERRERSHTKETAVLRARD